MNKINFIGIVLAMLTQCLICSSFAAEAKIGSNSPVQFISPNAFKCGETVVWSRLNDWNGESGQCRNGLLYTVIGKTETMLNGFIKANIVVPEDKNAVWSAFNGDTHNIVNGRFEVQFCITTKLATRPLLFQTYSSDGKKRGSQCTVTLVGVQLED